MLYYLCSVHTFNVKNNKRQSKVNQIPHQLSLFSKMEYLARIFFPAAAVWALVAFSSERNYEYI